MLRIARSLILLVITLAIIACIVVFGLNFYPKAYQTTTVHNVNAAAFDLAKPLKIMTWNIRFLTGNAPNTRYFYDDGDSPWPTMERMQTIAKRMAKVIVSQSPDVLFLQEVDRDSMRTQHKDELKILLSYLPEEYQHYSCAPMWLSRFFPHPAMLGRIHMDMCIISRYALYQGERFKLYTRKPYNIVTQQFLPKRALNTVYIHTTTRPTLWLVNTHYSAYTQGLDTVQRQAEMTVKIMQLGHRRSDGIILGGDFNGLPAAKYYDAVYPASQKIYSKTDTPIQILFDNYPSIPSLDDIAKNPAKWRTYMSLYNPVKEPDRTIDYFFLVKHIKKIRAEVINTVETRQLSDHLPIFAVVQFSAK